MYFIMTKPLKKQPQEKMSVTLKISRSAIATLDRVKAKRIECGASRRQVQHGALVEEAIELLKRKEGL